MNNKNDNIRIAQFFLEDAFSFLKAYKILKKGFRDSHKVNEKICLDVNDNSITDRIKFVVNLSFACECSLKAMIFVNSCENTKTLHNKILTHDLEKLVKMLDTESLKKYKYTVTKDVKFSVSHRYSFDAFVDFYCNKEKDEYASLEFADEYYQQIDNWIRYVCSAYNKLLEKSPIENFNRLEEENNRLKEVKKINK